MRELRIRVVYYLDDISFADTRIHHQPDQEPIDSNENTGVPWFYVQYGSNENLVSVQENREDEKSNQASDEKKNIPKILSLGCKPDRENDGNDSSHRERIAIREVPTDGFSTTIANEYSELGISMKTIQGSSTGLELVVYNEHKAEWFRHPSAHRKTTSRTKIHHLRRRLRHRMGYNLPVGKYSRFLESRRKRTFNQCSETEDDPVCIETTQKRKQRKFNPTVQRQQNCHQICHKTRRNSVSNFTRIGSRNKGIDFGKQYPHTLSTYSGGREHQSRQPEQTGDSNIRTANSNTLVQGNLSALEGFDDRRLCSSSQPCTSDILEQTQRSICLSNRRISTNLAESRTVFKSAMETYFSNDTQVERRPSTVGSIGDTTVANTGMVANDITFGQIEADDFTENTSQFNMFNCMEVINHVRQQQGLSKKTSEILNLKNKPTTILEYLASQKKHSRSHLNGIRSGLASIYNIIHPQKGGLAKDLFIHDFFKSIQNINVKIPNKYQEVWDPVIILNFVRSKWHSNANIPLETLQNKTIILLSLGTMWRPSSDLGRLERRDVNFLRDKSSGELFGVTLLARTPKEGLPKESKLGCTEDKNICPVCTLWDYCEASFTTFEVDSESTEIEIGKNLNSNVDGEETEDVVSASLGTENFLLLELPTTIEQKSKQYNTC
ncbi:hypothetical protein G6F56_007530 [Rhizopus delemar]|nr:hypothetical protein G6F56_007530 [Rhizopus delemar]